MRLSLRKLRAVLLLATISGMFWGTAAVLGRVGFEWYRGGLVSLDVGLLFRSMFLTGFGFGFGGGACYALAVALLPQRGERPALSAPRSALTGALGGAVAFLAFRFLGPVAFHGWVSTVIPTGVLALLGAGFALAVQGTAARGRLPGSGGPKATLPPGTDR